MACTSTSTVRQHRDTSVLQQNNVPQGVQDYLAHADELPQPERATYQLQVVQWLVGNQDLTSAKQVFAEIDPTSLSGNDALQYSILQKQLAATSINVENAGAAIPTTSQTAQYHVALLLPVTGSMAESGKAIRDGFLLALQQNEGQANINLQVYDTGDENQVVSLYEQAEQSGAHLIIGPLSKPGVSQLADYLLKQNTWSHQPSVPVLALNQVDGDTPAYFYQFSLSPEDEVRQDVTRAAQAGLRQALILSAASSWGDRITQAFIQDWQAKGGSIVDTIRFADKPNLDADIQAALQLNKAQLARRVQNNTVPPSSIRRHDMDMIFLVTSAAQARQIKPLLNYYYAGDVPTYTLASVYRGTPNPANDMDVNGVVFCDAPWVIHPDEQMRTLQLNIETSYPATAQTYTRLYALGVDVYGLMRHVNDWQQYAGFAYDGATGRLSLNNNRQWQRQLPCAQFIDGQVKMLPCERKNNRWVIWQKRPHCLICKIKA